jgi:hypothetical protein
MGDPYKPRGGQAQGDREERQGRDGEDRREEEEEEEEEEGGHEDEWPSSVPGLAIGWLWECGAASGRRLWTLRPCKPERGCRYAHGSRLGSSKRVFPEPFLSHSYRLKRQTSKYSNACEPWLKPQATVWRGLARPIWPNRCEPSQAGPSRAVTSLVEGISFFK